MRQALFAQHYKHVHLKLRPKLRACYLCEVKVPGHMRRRHMEEAHGVPRPQCNACGKKFAFPFQVDCDKAFESVTVASINVESVK